MTLPLLFGDRLRRMRGPRTILDVDRIEVFEGEALAVLGPNGAGKSTLLHLLAMLESPSAGRVTFRGQAGTRGERELRAAAAVVLERPHLWRESVEYNVGLGLRVRGVPRRETDQRVHRACNAFGLADAMTAPVTSLSRGQAKRVAIAQALVLEPELLFLDEPTSGLDADARDALRRDLATLVRERATTLVLATHDRNEAFHLADRVAVLRDGTLLRTGSPVDLYSDPPDRYAGAPTGAELVLAGRVASIEGGALVVETGGLRLSAVGRGEVGAAVRIGYRPEDLILGRAVPTAGDLSARNLFYATVAERRDEPGLARIRLRGAVDVAALVTRSAADQLELEPGTRVTVRVKATALRVYAAAPPATAGQRVEPGPRAEDAPATTASGGGPGEAGEAATHDAREPAANDAGGVVAGDPRQDGSADSRRDPTSGSGERAPADADAERPDVRADSPAGPLSRTRPPEGPGRRRALRVLVVEDDPDAASVLADYLVQAGFAADVAHNVDEALDAAHARRPDALVTDIRLRGARDGLDLARALSEADPPPLLLAVSGYASVEERERARAVGIETIFGKPFDPATLVARLRAGLEDRPPG